jgi:hypothetical protein
LPTFLCSVSNNFLPECGTPINEDPSLCTESMNLGMELGPLNILELLHSFTLMVEKYEKAIVHISCNENQSDL